MTPDEIGARFAVLLGEGHVGHSVSGGGHWARATVDVPLDSWHTAVRAARDDADLAMDFFDWLSAVDELDAGFTIVTHLWSTSRRHGVLVRAGIADRSRPAAPSIVDVYLGAAWHERETHEMFGISFPGHPTDAEPKPLLLPPEFEGHPLRKDFILAARVAKPWPGAKEPGESHAGGRARQPMRPPGVPDPREWGPDANPPGPDASTAGPDASTAGPDASTAGPDPNMAEES
jgi:NADH-quinone oxidoreductase subunit C